MSEPFAATSLKAPPGASIDNGALSQAEEAAMLRQIFGSHHQGPSADFNQALCAAVAHIGARAGFRMGADAAATQPLTPEAVAAASGVRCRDIQLPDQWWCRDFGPLLAFLPAAAGGPGERGQPSRQAVPGRRGGADASNLAGSGAPTHAEEGVPDQTCATHSDAGPELDSPPAPDAPLVPVALLPSLWGGYTLFDPASGRRQRVNATLAARILSRACCYYAVFPDRELRLPDVLNFGSAQSWGDWGVVLVAGGASALLAVALPYAISLMFTDLVPAGDRGRVLQVGIALVLTALAAFGMDYVSALANTRMSGRTSLQLTAALWDRLLRLPAGIVQRAGAGQMAASLTAADELRNAVMQIRFSIVTRGQHMVVGLATLFVVAPVIAGAALVLAGVMCAVVWITMRLQDRAIREGKPMQGDVFNQPIEYLNAIGKLRSAAAEERAYARWAADYTEMRRRAVRAGSVNTTFMAFCALFEVLAMMIVFWLVARPDGALGAMGLSGTLVLISALGTFMGTLVPLAQTIAMLRVTLLQARRLDVILRTAPAAEPRAAELPRLEGRVEVDNVSVRYDASGPLALRGVSLRAEPGEFIAVVGASGGGKSTLVKVLLGLLQPESGAVSYDGHDLQSLPRDALRRQIGTVMQGGHLIPGTLLDNIIGPHDATLDDAWDAARLAAVADDIAAMPMQMYTMVLDGASSFSGGQVQRIMVARSLVSKPPIILFDEATSALDGRTQQELVRRMAALKCTRIVIAHRFSTVRMADRIYVMQHGSITEQGSVDELIRAGGYVTEVARRERLGADLEDDDSSERDSVTRAPA